MSNTVEQFKHVYHNLDKNNIASIEKLYQADVVFIDPFHQIQGLDQLTRYFENMYSNVDHCNFEFGDALVNGHCAALFWSMNLTHPKLNGGKTISVPGSSLIRFTDKITYHRDYFDAGALVYEQVPVLNRVIKFIKERL